MKEFWFDLVLFGGVDECANSGGLFSNINEGDVVSGGGDVLRVAEAATSEYLLELEGVKVTYIV